MSKFLPSSKCFTQHIEMKIRVLNKPRNALARQWPVGKDDRVLTACLLRNLYTSLLALNSLCREPRTDCLVRRRLWRPHLPAQCFYRFLISNGKRWHVMSWQETKGKSRYTIPSRIACSPVIKVPYQFVYISLYSHSKEAVRHVGPNVLLIAFSLHSTPYSIYNSLHCVGFWTWCVSKP